MVCLWYRRYLERVDKLSDIVDLGAQEIADLVKSSKVSATQVVEAHLDEISRYDSRVNAFLLVMAENALEQAKRIDVRRSKGEELGPLAGVPIALKDNMAVSGFATTCGSKILEGWKPPYTATAVKRLVAADAVLIGKTNLDEFAMGSSTENSAYFPTKNPIDPTKVPGGSSGGSAASVAARFTPIAIGSDTGGSIRQPASLCGIVGVKPTYGLVSRYGLVAFASSLDQIGPFARNVQDAALALQVLAGHDDRDSTSIPGSHFDNSFTDRVAGLRIGVIQEMTTGISGAVEHTLNDAIAFLRSMGATVEAVSIPSTTYGLSAYYLIAPAEASSNLSRFDGVRYGLRVPGADITQTYEQTGAEGFGAEVKRRMMLGTYALSAGYYDALYGRAQKVRTLILDDFAKAYGAYDVLISPTSPTVAFGLGDKTDPLAMYMADVCTIPSNLAGHPAMSVPFGCDEAGLPIGIQVLAPAMGEQIMFSVAQSLQNGAAKPAVPVWRRD